MSTVTRPRKANGPKLGLDLISTIDIADVRPSPENDKLYRPVDPKNLEIAKLAKSIRQHGLLEPITISADGYIVSGHRRYTACILAGLTMIPVRRLEIRRSANPKEFIRLLREHNRQRDKTRSEKLREELVDVDPDDAHAQLAVYRRERAALGVQAMTIHGIQRRAHISPAKRPFLEAIQAVLEKSREFWPRSVRGVHYGLVSNDPPLIHASKPGSVYRNNPASYKALVELAARARLTGEIPAHAIADETRPVSVWDVHDDVRTFERRELDGLLRGFWRNLMQSQPNHIEIVGEKNTVLPILRPIAAEYTIPLTIGRGYCSLSPRHAMAQRYFKSGKEKLILLVVSDHDPDGVEIAQSFARSMRDDFDIEDIHPIRVALTVDQVEERDLQPNMVAKEKSVNRKKFVSLYGENVYELEALEPADLQQILRSTIESVIDRDAYAAEIEAEKADAKHLEGVRRLLLEAAKGIGEVDE